MKIMPLRDIHPNVLLVNYIQSVITTWCTHKTVRWEQHSWHLLLDPEMMYRKLFNFCSDNVFVKHKTWPPWQKFSVAFGLIAITKELLEKHNKHTYTLCINTVKSALINMAMIQNFEVICNKLNTYGNCTCVIGPKFFTKTTIIMLTIIQLNYLLLKCYLSNAKTDNIH